MNIDKVNLVGMSLGGMVAEEFAIKNPDRILTLTTIMFSGNIYDPELQQPSNRLIFDFT